MKYLTSLKFEEGSKQQAYHLLDTITSTSDCSSIRRLVLNRTSLTPDSIKLLHHFTGCEVLHLIGRVFRVLTFSQVKEHFDDPAIMPQLEELVIQFREERLSITDRQMKIRYSSSVRPPPSARLVGIELNPGPSEAGEQNCLVSTAVASSLFTDGLHEIIRFLDLRDFVAFSLTCRSWLNAAATCRNLGLILDIKSSEQLTKIFATSDDSSIPEREDSFVSYSSSLRLIHRILSVSLTHSLALSFSGLKALFARLSGLHQLKLDLTYDTPASLSDREAMSYSAVIRRPPSLLFPSHLTRLIVNLYSMSDIPSQTYLIDSIGTSSSLCRSLIHLRIDHLKHIVSLIALARLHSLTSLEIDTTPPGYQSDGWNFLQRLIEMSQITTLRLLTCNTLTTAILQELVDTKINFPRLTHLTFQRWPSDLLPLLPLVTPNLESLVPVSMNWYSQALFENFTHCTRLTQLREIAISHVAKVKDLDHPVAAAVIESTLLQCRSLTSIHFSNFTYQHINDWSRLFSELPLLRTLIFTHLQNSLLTLVDRITAATTLQPTKKPTAAVAACPASFSLDSSTASSSSSSSSSVSTPSHSFNSSSPSVTSHQLSHLTFDLQQHTDRVLAGCEDKQLVPSLLRLNSLQKLTLRFRISTPANAFMKIWTDGTKNLKRRSRIEIVQLKDCVEVCIVFAKVS